MQLSGASDARPAHRLDTSAGHPDGVLTDMPDMHVRS
jgi:hypothetical protein